jgi:hypothetical protein
MKFIDCKDEEVVVGDRVAYTHATAEGISVGYVKNIKRGKQRTFIHIQNISNNSRSLNPEHEVVVDSLDAEINNNEIRLYRVVKI